MGVRPSDRLLEIGPGSSDSIAEVAARLIDGYIVGVDRSPTAIARASKRHAAHIDSGRASLVHAGLETLRPEQVGVDPGLVGSGFDKVFAVNVNLFWTKRPTAELDLIRQLLRPNGALYLFYGYGSPVGGSASSPKPAPGKLIEHLADAGFHTRTRTSGDLLAVIAT